MPAIHDLIDALQSPCALVSGAGRLIGANTAWRERFGVGADGGPIDSSRFSLVALGQPEVRAIRLKDVWLLVGRNEPAPLAREEAVGPKWASLIGGLAHDAEALLSGMDEAGLSELPKFAAHLQQIRLVTWLAGAPLATPQIERVEACDMVESALSLPLDPAFRMTVWAKNPRSNAPVYGDRLHLAFVVNTMLHALSRSAGRPLTVLFEARDQGKFLTLRFSDQCAARMPRDVEPMEISRTQAASAMFSGFSWDTRLQVAERMLALHGARWNMSKLADGEGVIEIPTGIWGSDNAWEQGLLEHYAKDLNTLYAANRPKAPKGLLPM